MGVRARVHVVDEHTEGEQHEIILTKKGTSETLSIIRFVKRGDYTMKGLTRQGEPIFSQSIISSLFNQTVNLFLQADKFDEQRFLDLVLVFAETIDKRKLWSEVDRYITSTNDSMWV